MSKQTESKLDPFAEQLDQWLASKKNGGDGLTLQQTCARLSELECSVSSSTLSVWWSKRLKEKQTDHVLNLIASGAQQNKQVDAAFKANPEPELEGLMRLFKTLIFTLQVQGATDPKMLNLANNLTQTVLMYFDGKTKAKQKEKQLEQADRRLEMMERKAAACDRAKEEIQKLRDPNAALNEDERKAIVAKVDEILGLK